MCVYVSRESERHTQCTRTYTYNRQNSQAWRPYLLMWTCTCSTLCVRLSLSTYMRAYIHTHMHTYIPTYLPTCIRTQVRPCMHACMYMHVCICIRHAHMHTCIHTYRHTNTKPACSHAVLCPFEYMCPGCASGSSGAAPRHTKVSSGPSCKQ